MSHEKNPAIISSTSTTSSTTISSSSPLSRKSPSSSSSSSSQIDPIGIVTDVHFAKDQQSTRKDYEELFDSGYNSNMQSKTFLDLDSEFQMDQRKQLTPTSPMSPLEPTPPAPPPIKSTANTPFREMSKYPTQQQPQNETKFDSVQQWTDSGVCITDSGLSIGQEDENYELIYSKDNVAVQNQTQMAVKNDMNDDDQVLENRNALEMWLKNNSDAETLLHLAIIEGLEDIAVSIIQNISTSNEMLSSYNYLYQSPLHLAVLKRQMNVIEHLIEKGCSLTFQDNLGNTPLHIACKYSLNDIVELIINTAHKSVSKCLEIRNYDGDTCLHLAAYNEDIKLLELLIRAGANIDIQEGKSGKTILHWAVENLHVQLVNFLFKHNANIQAETFAGKTPLHFLLKASMKSDSPTTTTTTNSSLNFNTNNNHPSSFLTKSKINKIIRMSIEYCNERKLSLETISSSSNVSESDSSEDEN